MDNNNTAAGNDQTVQLSNYIRQQLQSGLNPNEIHAQLKQAGWTDEAIQAGFAHVQQLIMPNLSGPQPGTVTRGRFKTGWLLFKQSLKVLRQNEGLTRYVLMSFLFSLGLTLIFTVIFVLGRHSLITTTTAAQPGNNNLTPTALGYLILFVYYVLAFFIVNIYSAGLVSNVLDLFQGQAKHYKDYMKAARAKSGKLFIFSVIEATVGLILRVIAERSKLLGRIIVYILGAAWSLARLFVVPVIVTTDDNAVAAIKRSTQLLISTWGENLAGRVSFAGIAFLVYLFILLPISLVLIFLGAAIGHVVGAIVGAVLAILLYIAFSILVSTASSVMNTALFYYAQNRQVPPAFDPSLINSVFISRKRKNLLGLGR